MAEPEPPPLTLQALPRACNEALILSALAGGPRHGYQLVLDLEQRSGGAFRLRHGTLYPILHKLEEDGLIEGAWSDEGPRGKRKAYRLTPAGERFAERQRADLTALLELVLRVVGGRP
ncbi:MAG: helix-turn-helix transcriptional regulator [Planctomycetes bacterium]|nr:helix-turn-helix transcriptional regulator [Planctomycetota bacterium]